MCLAFMLKVYISLPLVPVADYLGDLTSNSDPNSIRKVNKEKHGERGLYSLGRIDKGLQQSKPDIELDDI